ncbi:MAG: HAMP domain-containing protein, partial [Pseudonocardiaceae bacterium]
MSLRTRLTLVVAATVAFAVIAGAYAAHYSTGRELRSEVDTFLLDRMDGFTRHPPIRPFDNLGPGIPPGERGRLFDFDSIAQVIDPSGRILASIPMGTTLPVTKEDLEMAEQADSHAHFRDINISEGHFRMLTAAIPGGRKVQIARSLGETDEVLAGLRNRLGLIALFGTALAGLGAWAVARRHTQPIEDLTKACERVAATQDLTTPVPSSSGGELGRLALSFNTMLTA